MRKIVGAQVYLSPLEMEDAPLYVKWLNVNHMVGKPEDFWRRP